MFSDLLTDRRATLCELCEWLGLAWDECLLTPTWNGRPIMQLFPFGGISEASIAHEEACVAALVPDERETLLRQTAGTRELYDIDRI